MKLNELEMVLLDQIEKLNDDSVGEDEIATKLMVDRSKAISDLANNVMSLNRLKLDVVKCIEINGELYDKYLGLEDDTRKKTL